MRTGVTHGPEGLAQPARGAGHTAAQARRPQDHRDRQRAGAGRLHSSAVANNKTHTDVPDTSSTPHPWDTLAVEHIYQHRQAAAATRKKSPVSQRLRGALEMVVEHGCSYCVNRSCVRCVDYRRGAEDGRTRRFLTLCASTTRGTGTAANASFIRSRRPSLMINCPSCSGVDVPRPRLSAPDHAMPIRPENRARYPLDWPARSRFIRTYRARGRCEWCGARNGQPHPDTGNRVFVQVALGVV